MAISVKSAFWNDDYRGPISERNLLDPSIGRALNRPGMAKTKELLLTLLGVAPGATALASVVRIQANTQENGGKRVIETVPVINRATTSDDVTEMTKVLVNNMAGVYVPSRSLRA